MSARMLAGALVCALVAMVLAAFAFAPPAHAQQSQADCAYGWVYANGQCQPPPSGNGGGSNDAACQATAQFNYCQASVSIGCRVQGFPYACRLLQLSYSNPGQFQQLMNAQRACLYGNQQACAFLQQFRGIYF
jgi:hypothetical protein